VTRGWCVRAWGQRPSDAVALIEKSPEKVPAYTRSLRDFVCTEVTPRYRGASFARLDKLKHVPRKGQTSGAGDLPQRCAMRTVTVLEAARAAVRTGRKITACDGAGQFVSHRSDHGGRRNGKRGLGVDHVRSYTKSENRNRGRELVCLSEGSPFEIHVQS
jgi:hypothetical protein